MLIATVIGPVWASKRIPELPAGALLEVQCRDSRERYVALDMLGSGPGDEVLITQGSAATVGLDVAAPLDARIVGVLDPPTSSTHAKEKKK